MARPLKLLNENEKQLAVKLALAGRPLRYILTQLGIKLSCLTFNCDNDDEFQAELLAVYGRDKLYATQTKPKLGLMSDEDMDALWKAIRKMTDSKLRTWTPLPGTYANDKGLDNWYDV